MSDALLDLAPDAIIVRDPLDRVVFWNRAAQALYGWSRREALGVVVHELLRTRFPTDRAEVLAVLQRDGIWDGVLHHQTRDRGEIVTWSRWAAIRDDQGRVVSVLETNRDVTATERDAETLRSRMSESQSRLERHELEQSVARDDAARLRTIINSAMDAVITVDDESRIVMLNPAAERMFAITLADASGQPLARFVPTLATDASARLGTEPQAPARGGVHQGRELAARRADGLEFPVEVAVVDVRVGGRDTRSVLLRDVSERHLLGEQFRQAQKMEAIGRLAGGIAHDFNNLLSAITGYLELLRPAVSDPDAIADLDEANHATHRAAQLTRQLLIFSRNESSRRRVVSPNDVVIGIERLLRRVIGEDIRFETRLDPAVPRVRVDPGQLEHALLNLVINARDAMPSGGTITITTRGERNASGSADREPDSALAVVEVADTGSGMVEGVRVRAFEPFFTTKDPDHGTGLGLAAVRGLATEAGGDASIESEPGSGTVVRMTLPAAKEPDGDDAAETDVRDAAPPRRYRLLLVEDENVVRALARRLLEARGHSVFEARTGDDALARWREVAARGELIDAVVTDVVMPDMGGRELIARLRQLLPALPVVYVSGYPQDMVSGLDMSGRAQLIDKPFSGESLNAAVELVCRAPADKTGV